MKCWRRWRRWWWQLAARRVRPPPLAPLAVAIASVLFLLPGFRRAGHPMEEGQVLMAAELVGRGALPNVDFESSYGPANVALLALASRLLGPSVGVERLLGLCYRLLLVGGTYLLAAALAPGARRREACLAALISSAFLASTGVSAIAWLAGIACALWSLWALHRALATAASWRLFATAGALAGACVCFRVDLGPAVALSALPLLWPAAAGRKLAYAGGAAIGSLPLAVHVARIGASAAWRGMYVETVVLAGPGRRLPIPPRAPLDAFFFAAAVLAAGTMMWLPARQASRQRLDPGARAWLALAALSLGMLPQLLQRADRWHAIEAACACLPLLPAAAANAFVSARARRAARLALTALAGSAAAVSLVVGLDALVADVRWVAVGTRRFPLAPALAADLEPVLRTLDAAAHDGDTLFVGPRDLRRTNYGDTFVYFLMPRLRPASYFTEMNPGVANRAGSSLARDVARADFLLLTDRFDAWNEPNASSVLGPDAPSLIVQRRFCRLAAAGAFELLARCGRQ